MKTLILFDSFFGNTEQIAHAIGSALESCGPVTVLRVSEARPGQLTGVDLLVVGSPTRGFRPSEATQAFFKSLPAGALTGVKAAAFDTRARVENVPAFLRFMIRLFGYAAEKIAKQLKEKGGTPLQEPAGFFVKDTQGPLYEGELERAAQWGAALGKG